MLHRKKKEGGSRDKDSSAVKISEQIKVYVSNFDSIDTRNLKCKVRPHGPFQNTQLVPKINQPILRYELWLRRNVLWAPISSVYTWKTNDQSKTVNGWLNTYSVSAGPTNARTSISHLPVFQNLASLHTSALWIKIQSDARDVMGSVSEASNMIAAPGTSVSRMVRAVSSVKVLWYKQQKRFLWHQHQNLAYEKRGLWAYKDCPGIAASKKCIQKVMRQTCAVRSAVLC